MHISGLPQPAQRNIAIHIKPAAERALRDGHPWLFEGSIREQSKAGNAGDLAVIFDKKRRFLAIGLYDPNSPVRVKVLQHKTPATINDDFFKTALQEAAAQRGILTLNGTTGYRLVHGENDGLPGLIIDRYGETLVIKLYTAAWFPHLNAILAALDDVQPAQNWVLRLGRNTQTGDTYGLCDGQQLRGDPITMPVKFVENGLTFSADVLQGHKTGFFCDQRDNRLRVRQLAAGKRVLDVFSYNGGFTVSAAAGGATSVLSVDISEPALQSVRENVALNQNNANVAACDVQTLCADAFDALADLTDKFDLVIVDPPSFANSADQVAGALNAYTRLMQLALPRITERGTLMMASCSSRVSADDFYSTIYNAARGYHLHEIERTAHAIDHPIGFPEGAYLKALFATVR